MTQRILQLPGWQGSNAAHWQTRWESLYGDERVEQNDWNWPLRGDWMSRLDEVVQSAMAADSGTELVLVAHSLGCHLVASWAGHSRHTRSIKAAMLVAPPDTERGDAPPNLFSWRRTTRETLPFQSLTVISTDDPYCDESRARALAASWGSQVASVGPAGHINSSSMLGDWSYGRQLLNNLRGSPDTARP